MHACLRKTGDITGHRVHVQYSQDGQSPAGGVVTFLGVSWAPGRLPVFSRLARSASLSLDSGYCTDWQASAAPNDTVQGHRSEASNRMWHFPPLRPPPSPRPGRCTFGGTLVPPGRRPRLCLHALLATQATRDGVDQALPVLLGGR